MGRSDPSALRKEGSVGFLVDLELNAGRKCILKCVNRVVHYFKFMKKPVLAHALRLWRQVIVTDTPVIFKKQRPCMP